MLNNYKLTFTERLEVYCFALSYVGRSSKMRLWHYCICPLLIFKLKEIKGIEEIEEIDFDEVFPELAKHKPEGKIWGEAWFNVFDAQSRRKVLLQCVEEIVNKINQ